MFAALTFGMSTLEDPHNDWVGWLWDAGVAVLAAVLVVCALRRAPHFKQSLFVKVMGAAFALVFATDLAVTASRGWRDEPPVLTALLVAAVSVAIVAMLLAGRAPLRGRRRPTNR